MQKMMTIRWVIIAIIVGLAIDIPQATIAQTPMLSVGQMVVGSIGVTEAQAWELLATDNGDLTLLVRAIDGDLDPFVTVYDSDGEVVSINDDAVSGVVLDSATTFSAEAGNTYRIVVEPFAGSGRYQLWALPTDLRMVWDVDTFADGVIRWSSPYTRQESDRLIYETGRLIDRSIVLRPAGQVSITDAYLQVAFSWRSTAVNTAFGLVLRTADDAFTPDAYYFNLNPMGAWAIVRQQFDQLVVLDEGTLAEPPQNWSIGAAAIGDNLRLYIGGEQITTLTDATFASGGWGLHLRGDGVAAGVALEHMLLTTALIDPPEAPTTITNWRAARADDIAAELAEAEAIPSNGRRVYTVLETSYQAAPQSTRTYPQVADGVSYSDIVLNVDVIVAEGEDVACGVVARDNGAGDRVVFYAGKNGGAGLVVLQNGVMRAHTYDLLPPTDLPLADNAIRLTLILRGPYMVAYVNGTFFTIQYIPPSSGSLGVALLNYATDSGRCTFRNFWVWQ